MARYGYTLTLPTLTGTHANEVVLLRAKEFPTAAIDGGATSILNGGGNLRAYTDDTKTTQLPVEIFSFVTGGTPLIHVEVKLPSVFTSATIYVESDDVATTQPAVTDTYGRNSVWSEYEFVSHDLTVDSTGNYPSAFTTSGNPTQVDSPFGIPNGAYDFDGSGDFIDVNDSSRNPLLGLTSSDSVTVQAFLSTDDSNTHNRAVHIRSTTQSGIQLLQNVAAGGDTFGIASLNGSGTATPRYKESASPSDYNNVVGVTEFDGASSPDSKDLLYIDGDSTSQLSGSTNLGGGTARNAIRFGARTDGSGTYFGRVSEVKYRKSVIDPDWAVVESNNRDPSDASPWGTVGTWESQGSSGFTLDIDGAVYGYGGDTTQLSYNRALPVLSAAYSYTSEDIALLSSRLLSADSANYSYSGGDVVALFDRLIPLTGINYSYSGSALDLVYSQLTNYQLSIDGGDYSYVGGDYQLLLGRNIAINGGSLIYTGASLALVYTEIGGYSLDIDGVNYSYLGSNITAAYNRDLSLAGSNYSYVGGDANSLYNRNINLFGATYNYDGGDTQSLYNRSIPIDGVNYDYNGGVVGLVYSGAVTLLIDGYSVQFKQDDISIKYQSDNLLKYQNEIASINYGSVQ